MSVTRTQALQALAAVKSQFAKEITPTDWSGHAHDAAEYLARGTRYAQTAYERAERLYAEAAGSTYAERKRA